MAGIKLRTILLISVVVFVLIIILRVTNGLKYILQFFEVAGLYIVLLTVLLLIGYLVFLFFFNRRIDRETDIEAKSWNFLQEWWTDKMGMIEPLKLQDGFMKRGYYDSGQGMTEMFVGFNITKKGSNQRIIFVVGTKPMTVAHVDNRPFIDKDQDPFLNFYPIPPKPVPHFEDSALKMRFSGANRGYFPQKPEKKQKQDEGEEEIIEG